MTGIEPQPNRIFSDDQIKRFGDLGNILLNVHRRLIAESYTIENGVITPPLSKQKEVQ